MKPIGKAEMKKRRQVVVLLRTPDMARLAAMALEERRTLGAMARNLIEDALAARTEKGAA